MIKGVIFDLDQTIVNSLIAERERKVRNWSKVYTLIPSFTLYSGFKDVFEYIRKQNLKCCIVTSSPGAYAQKVIKHFDVPNDFIVDFFKTQRRKPSSEPMLKALELMELSYREVVSFGDQNIDIISSKEANILSVACLWGSSDSQLLLNSSPDLVIHEVSDIISILKNN